MADEFLRTMTPFSDEMVEATWQKMLAEVDEIINELGNPIVEMSKEEIERLTSQEKTTPQEEIEIWVGKQLHVAIEELKTKIPERLAKSCRKQLLEDLKKWASNLYLDRCKQLELKPVKYHLDMILGPTGLCLEIRDIICDLHSE